MPSLPHANAYWAAPGLLAAEYPGAPSPEAAAAKVRAYLDAGVTAFLDLTEAGELEPYAPLLPETAAYARHPFPDMAVPTVAEMSAALDRIDSWLAEGRTVCVHCWGGIGRTGTLVACRYVRHGDAPEAALDRLAAQWQTVEKRTRYPRSPQTGTQVAFVRAWPVGG